MGHARKQDARINERKKEKNREIMYVLMNYLLICNYINDPTGTNANWSIKLKLKLKNTPQCFILTIQVNSVIFRSLHKKVVVQQQEEVSEHVGIEVKFTRKEYRWERWYGRSKCNYILVNIKEVMKERVWIEIRMGLVSKLNKIVMVNINMIIKRCNCYANQYGPGW